MVHIMPGTPEIRIAFKDHVINKMIEQIFVFSKVFIKFQKWAIFAIRSFRVNPYRRVRFKYLNKNLQLYS